MSNDADEIAAAFMADCEMQDTQDYLERGRSFASSTVEALSQAWVAAMTAVAFGHDEQLEACGDLAAELRLRRLPLPEHLLPPEVLAALGKRVAESTPEHYEAVESRVRQVRESWIAGRAGKG